MRKSMELLPSFYSHGNGLSASVLPTVNPQVSSVGFNTLKKWNTTALQTLENFSINTITTKHTNHTTATNKNRPKGLSRFFTRNKSGTSVHTISNNPNTISGSASPYYNEADDLITLNSLDPVKSSTSSMFKFSKLKSAKTKPSLADLYGSGSGETSLSKSGKRTLSTSKPDLKIQTHGHHGLKVPKKILSSNQIEDNGRGSLRKASVSSPVSTFQNLFARFSHSNLVSAPTSSSKDDHLTISGKIGLGIDSEQSSSGGGEDSSAASAHGHVHGEHDGSIANPNLTNTNIASASTNNKGHIYQYRQFLGSNNPNRTAIGLSSQNSNSAISDIAFAMIYNFTDPDYSVDLFDSGGNQTNIVRADEPQQLTTTMIKENLQKKILMPTDQYLQAKLGRNHNTSHENHSHGYNHNHNQNSLISSSQVDHSAGAFSIYSNFGGGVVTPERYSAADSGSNVSIHDAYIDEYSARYLLDFSNRNAQFFIMLVEVFRPLFMPSQKRKLNNGTYHSYIGMTLEDVSNYVQENYVKQLAVPGSSSSGSGFGAGFKIGPGQLGSGSSFLSGLGIGGYGAGDEFNTSPISTSKRKHKLSRTASTANTAIEARKLDDVSIREVYQDLLSFCMRCLLVYNKDYSCVKKGGSGGSGLSGGYKRDWENIVHLWDYFNQGIKYQMITIFYPLEKLFRKLLVVEFPNLSISIIIENIVLLAFRDAILIPFLMERMISYDRQQPQQQQQQRALEEIYLKENDGSTLGKVIECFGVIFTRTSAEMGNADGEEHIRAQTFRQAFDWLTGIL